MPTTEVVLAPPALSADGAAPNRSIHLPELAVGCAEYPFGRRGRHAGFSAVDAYPQQFHTFLGALKKAVAANDKEAVASLADLRLAGLSRADFLRRYEEIMSPCLKESVRCTTLDSVAEDYLGAWVAHDALLVEFDVVKDRFAITKITGEGPCYRQPTNGSQGVRQ